jgi:hypothetical protein
LDFGLDESGVAFVGRLADAKPVRTSLLQCRHGGSHVVRARRSLVAADIQAAANQVTASNSDANNADAPSAGDNLRVVQKWLRKEMVARGFTRIRTKDTWRRGTSATGWLVVERLTSRHRVGGSAYITLSVAVWTAGTWESELAVSFARHLESEEPERGGAPVGFGPKDFVGTSADWFLPGRAGADFLGLGGNWWEVGPGETFDASGLESKLSGFLDAVDGARLLEPEQALSVLLGHRNFRSWRYAAAIMDTSGMRGQQFQHLVEKLSETWIADPRPATFRTSLLDLRAKAGLPEIELPDPPHTLI